MRCWPSCNSAQGRVQAVLWLVERSDGIALILPASMVERTATRLRKYVLRQSEVERCSRLDERAMRRAADAAPHACQQADEFLRCRACAMLARRSSRSRSASDMPGASTSAPACRRSIPKRTKRSSRRCSISTCSAASASRRAATRARRSSRARTFAARSSDACSASSAPCPPPAPGTRILAGEQHAGDVVDAAATRTAASCWRWSASRSRRCGLEAGVIAARS